MTVHVVNVTSAIGSSSAPNALCCFNSLATFPSNESVIAAKSNIKKAAAYLPLSIIYITNGAAIIRSEVMKFGRVRIDFI
jgi:hypothetical protein